MSKRDHESYISVAQSKQHLDVRILQNMTIPEVTVVIPVYNSVDYLAEAVDSALSQEGVSIEVILVDDGSADGSKELAKKIAAKSAHVIALEHLNGANLGVSKTRLLGIQEAQAPYLALLDADDVFEPGKLRCQLEAFASDPNIVMVHTGLSGIDSSSKSCENEPTDWLNANPTNPEGYEYLELPTALKENHICNSSVLIKSKFLYGLPLGMTQFFQFEDWMLWCLLAEKGRFRFIPEPLTKYRFHEASFTSKLLSSQLMPLYSQLELLLTISMRAASKKLSEKARDEVDQVIWALSKIYRSESEVNTIPKLASTKKRVIREKDLWSYILVKVEKKLRVMFSKFV